MLDHYPLNHATPTKCKRLPLAADACQQSNKPIVNGTDRWAQEKDSPASLETTRAQSRAWMSAPQGRSNAQQSSPLQTSSPSRASHTARTSVQPSAAPTSQRRALYAFIAAAGLSVGCRRMTVRQIGRHKSSLYAADPQGSRGLVRSQAVDAARGD